jgi:hypothetical protein
MLLVTQRPTFKKKLLVSEYKEVPHSRFISEAVDLHGNREILNKEP